MFHPASSHQSCSFYQPYHVWHTPSNRYPIEGCRTGTTLIPQFLCQPTPTCQFRMGQKRGLSPCFTDMNPTYPMYPMNPEFLWPQSNPISGSYSTPCSLISGSCPLLNHDFLGWFKWTENGWSTQVLGPAAGCTQDYSAAPNAKPIPFLGAAGRGAWGIVQARVIAVLLEYPLVNYQNYGKSQFFMGKSTIHGHVQ